MTIANWIITNFPVILFLGTLAVICCSFAILSNALETSFLAIDMGWVKNIETHRAHIRKRNALFALTFTTWLCYVFGVAGAAVLFKWYYPNTDHFSDITFVGIILVLLGVNLLIFRRVTKHCKL